MVKYKIPIPKQVYPHLIDKYKEFRKQYRVKKLYRGKVIYLIDETLGLWGYELQLLLLFYALLPETKVLVADGCYRGGKSFMNNYISTVLYSKFITNNPEETKVRHALCGRTIATIERNIIDDRVGWNSIFEIAPTGRGAKTDFWNKKDGYLSINNRRVYTFGGSTARNAGNISGGSFGIILVDEGALVHEDVLKALRNRCDRDDSKLIISTNPNDPNHYLYTDIITKANGKDIKTVTFTLDDTPFITDTVKQDYKNRLQGVELDRFYYGKWTKSEGLIYPEFEKSVRRIEVKTLPPSWRSKITREYVIIDAGEGSKTVFLYGVFMDDLRYRIMSELVFDHKNKNYDNGGSNHRNIQTSSDYIDAMENWLQSNNIPIDKKRINCIYDPSPATNGIKAELAKRGYRIYTADKKVELGIDVTRAMIHDGYILVSSECTTTIQESKGYSKDSNGKVIKENDDCMDCIRYSVYNKIGVTDYARHLINNLKMDKESAVKYVTSISGYNINIREIN